jgi:hypothetical protein
MKINRSADPWWGLHTLRRHLRSFRSRAFALGYGVEHLRRKYVTSGLEAQNTTLFLEERSIMPKTVTIELPESN